MRNRKAALGFIFVTIMIDMTGLGIIIPVMPKLITELTGGSISNASVYGGWLIFVYAFFQFLFAPILGGISDKVGRRPVLLFSLFGLGVDYLVLAQAPNITWLFIGRMIAGIGGASITTASAYIADISEPEKRAQNFGMIGAAFGLGFIIGPVIGGLLGELGPRIPFYAAAGLSLLNWLYGYFVIPESLDQENRRPFSWKRANPVGTLLHLKRYPAILGLFASIFLVYLAAHAVQSTWAYYTIETFKWSEADVGYSLGFVGVVVALVQGVLIRPVVKAIGQVKAIYVGLAFNAFGLSLFAFATEGWMIYAILVPYALGGFAGPSMQSIITSQVPGDEQGELQGGMTSMASVTSIIGPVMMTSIFAYFTDTANQIYFPGAPFIVATVLAIISMILVIRSLRGSKIKS